MKYKLVEERFVVELGYVGSGYEVVGSSMIDETTIKEFATLNEAEKELPKDMYDYEVKKINNREYSVVRYVVNTYDELDELVHSFERENIYEELVKVKESDIN